VHTHPIDRVLEEPAPGVAYSNRYWDVGPAHIATGTDRV